MERPHSPKRDMIFVTVGTDHHPFDRLIEWTDAWAAEGGHNGALVPRPVRHLQGAPRSPAVTTSATTRCARP